MNKLLILLLPILLMACSKNSHVPDTSILDEIPSQELSDVLDYENKHPVNGYSFEEMYPTIRNIVNDMSEIEKAKFAKLTYRELFNSQCAVDDTIQQAKYRKEWQRRYDELLPHAKAKATQIESEITTGYRIYAYHSNSYNLFSFRNYLRQNGYNKYLKTNIVGPQYIDDDSWNYEVIMMEYLDRGFKPEDEWITNKILDDTQSKYPLGTEFLRQQYDKSYQSVRNFRENL